VRIADVPLPVAVANPVIFPYNLPSRKLAPLAPRLQAVQQGSDLLVLDEQGNIGPAGIPDQPRAKPGPVDGCGYLVQDSFKRIPVTPVVPGPLWTRVDYFANDDGAVTINAGEMTRTIDVEQGLHQLIFLTAGDFSSVWFQGDDPDLSVCVDNIHVGPVLPKEDLS